MSMSGPRKVLAQEQEGKAMNLDLILTIAAFVLFCIAAAGVPSRVNLVAAGLACLTLTQII